MIQSRLALEEGVVAFDHLEKFFSGLQGVFLETFETVELFDYLAATGNPTEVFDLFFVPWSGSDGDPCSSWDPQGPHLEPPELVWRPLPVPGDRCNIWRCDCNLSIFESYLVFDDLI